MDVRLGMKSRKGAQGAVWACLRWSSGVFTEMPPKEEITVRGRNQNIKGVRQIKASPYLFVVGNTTEPIGIKN